MRKAPWMERAGFRPIDRAAFRLGRLIVFASDGRYFAACEPLMTSGETPKGAVLGLRRKAIFNGCADVAEECRIALADRS